MTTRAEEIAAEGPYKVESYTRGVRKLTYFRVVGPSKTGVHSVLTRYIADRQAKLLNAAYNQGHQERWISVEERLPEDGYWVLTFSAGVTDDFQWDIGYWDVSGKWKCLGWDYPVTHWMPLPLPPNPEQR